MPMLDVTSANEIADDVRVRGNVVRLAAAQALTGANSAVIFATGSIVRAAPAPRLSLPTGPPAMYVGGGGGRRCMWWGCPPAPCRPALFHAPTAAAPPSSSARLAASQPACSPRSPF